MGIHYSRLTYSVNLGGANPQGQAAYGIAPNVLSLEVPLTANHIDG